MSKINLIILAVLAVLVIAGAVALFMGGPSYSADDFTNQPLVQVDPDLTDAERTQLAAAIEEEFAGSVTTSSLIRKAEAYAQAGLYIQALEILGAVSQKSGETAELLTARGTVLADMQQYRSAAESYEQAIELDKTYAGAYASYAELYVGHSQQRQRAVGLYEKAGELAEIEELKSKYQRRAESLKERL